MAESNGVANVLVVDDNRMNRLKLARAVEQLGHRVETAEDGRAALDLLRDGDVDAVLLDLVMPGMDGYAVLEHRHGDPALREIPVIVITAVDDDESVIRCLELGAEDHLPKDVHPLVLRARLRAVLARKERRDLERQLLAQELSLRQQEKLATLGRLAAGFAHELNNPAASARRGAEQLRTGLTRLEEEQLQLGRGGLRQDQVSWLADATARSGPDTEPGTRLSALERADLEERLEAALRSHGVATTGDLVHDLSRAGLSVAAVDEAAEVFGDDVGPALAWLATFTAVRQLVEQVGTAASRIAELVDRLKRYSYMDQAPEQEVDIHLGLNDTLAVMGTRLDAVTVRREFAPALPPISAHGSELNDVWTNLIDNALDAMGGRGTLTLRTRHEDATVVIEVEDDGPGIPDDLLPRVFDPFVTTKAPGEGTGLGLNGVHTTVTQRHGGSIAVDSEPGRTRFTVRLPTHAAERRPSGSEASGALGNPASAGPRRST